MVKFDNWSNLIAGQIPNWSNLAREMASEEKHAAWGMVATARAVARRARARCGMERLWCAREQSTDPELAGSAEPLGSCVWLDAIKFFSLVRRPLRPFAT